MTETEKMRAILHELGVEYRDVNSMVTDVEHDGIKTRVYDYDDGPDYQLCVEQQWLTAEEAVRVALGIKPQEVLERRIDELCAEVEAEKQRNAKLRELLRLMVRRHTPISPCKNIPCGECPVKDECDQEDALMRELGVEVEG